MTVSTTCVLSSVRVKRRMLVSPLSTPMLTVLHTKFIQMRQKAPISPLRVPSVRGQCANTSSDTIRHCVDSHTIINRSLNTNIFFLLYFARDFSLECFDDQRRLPGWLQVAWSIPQLRSSLTSYSGKVIITISSVSTDAHWRHANILLELAWSDFMIDISINHSNGLHVCHD